MAAKIYSCSCCGADVTCPQFFKGKVYGYSCITKVSKQKRVRDNGLWISFESVEIKKGNVVVTTKHGSRFVVARAYTEDLASQAYANAFVVDSELFRIAKYSNGTDGFYRGLDIKQERDQDGKGKLYPVSVTDGKGREYL